MPNELIDDDGRCELCGRLVPIECPEPDGMDRSLSASLEAANDGPTPDLDVPQSEPVHVGCPGGRECLDPGECVRISGCLRDVVSPPDPYQEPINLAYLSAGPDGRITAVYPNGEAYTDPTPRLGARGCEADELGPEDGRF